MGQPNLLKRFINLVPGGGIEPPTRGFSESLLIFSNCCTVLQVVRKRLKCWLIACPSCVIPFHAEASKRGVFDTPVIPHRPTTPLRRTLAAVRAGVRTGQHDEGPAQEPAFSPTVLDYRACGGGPSRFAATAKTDVGYPANRKS